MLNQIICHFWTCIMNFIQQPNENNVARSLFVAVMLWILLLSASAAKLKTLNIGCFGSQAPFFHNCMPASGYRTPKVNTTFTVSDLQKATQYCYRRIELGSWPVKAVLLLMRSYQAQHMQIWGKGKMTLQDDQMITILKNREWGWCWDGGGRHIMTSLWTLVKNHWSEVDRGVLWKPGRHLMSHLHERLQQSRYLLTHTSLISTGPFCLFKLMLVEHTFFFLFFFKS